MLRNLSDYLSLLTIIMLTINALHAFILSLISVEKDRNTDFHEKLEMIRDYINNEEE
ncbi:MAG: hypothetical protein IJH00_01425 [Erysipelotrichaceae bacterium]|nr:hypothetical protein [Erysipelotrichaceae bacterium]